METRLPTLDQNSFLPAQFYELDPIRTADSEVMPSVSKENVLGWRLEWSVFAEKLAALGLQNPDSYRIDSDRILTD